MAAIKQKPTACTDTYAAEEERRRESEDRMIQELEAQFWERTKSIQEGKVEPVLSGSVGSVR